MKTSLIAIETVSFYSRFRYADESLIFSQDYIINNYAYGCLGASKMTRYLSQPEILIFPIMTAFRLYG